MPERITIPMDASRVCFAISKIGYKPSAALMDIVDNSVAAGSRRVSIEIEVDTEKTLAEKRNVTKYRIIDNGCGMSDQEITNAFKLGSSANYPANSLSKYGMGMKSAGLSLGTEIKVISKKDNTLSSVNLLDSQDISSDYFIYRDSLSEEESIWAEGILGEETSGTIVEISGCQNIEQDSASKTIKALIEDLGVVYYEFLRKEDDPLSLMIKTIHISEQEITVHPLDILFQQNAVHGFHIDDYDCKTPCLVLRETIPLAEDESIPPISIEAVIFPQDRMSNFSGFSDEEKRIIKGYKIKRKNRGFFIYRNGRLIRWGDNLGIVQKDDYGFRARINISTSHDEMLHVDVSKQRLSIPEDILTKIETTVRQGLRASREAFRLCKELIKARGPGEESNERNQDFVIEDLDEPIVEDDIRESRQRRQHLVQRTEEAEEKIVEETPETAEGSEDEIEAGEISIFQKIRYSEKVESGNIWEAAFHPTYGDYVRINMNHPFYRSVLTNLSETDPSRLAFEAILLICAAAENKTYQNLPQVRADDIESVITKFKRILSYNLDTWCNTNQDIFNNG